MYRCYFLRIHPLCKPVVFKWVSWTTNISITWELVQGVNSGSTLNTFKQCFLTFSGSLFPLYPSLHFFLSFSSSPFLLWSMGSQRQIHHPSGSVLGRWRVRFSWRGALGVIILMEVLICHPQIKGKGHDLSACIDGTQWVAGHTLSSCCLSIWWGYWDLVI